MKLDEWVERHRLDGHYPHPTPTRDNPERWKCDCGAIWRILTIEQVQQKFAHLERPSSIPPGSGDVGNDQVAGRKPPP
ncbi:hypothetical protein ACDT10_24415 [Mycobacterium intracellulare]|uniref:hypothetical protein n=1 Tax=Mycobacterium intracellulare TaxID=1767 RepID=UPI0035565837